MKIVTIQITAADPERERWWNNSVTLKYQVVEKNATMYEVVSGPNIGNLIAKKYCIESSPIKANTSKAVA